jgi:hypothetical protein
MREGLVMELFIKTSNKNHIQHLDYTRVSFKCVRFHRYGHLIDDYEIQFKNSKKEVVPPNKKTWVEKEGSQHVL